MTAGVRFSDRETLGDALTGEEADAEIIQGEILKNPFNRERIVEFNYLRVPLWRQLRAVSGGCL